MEKVHPMIFAGLNDWVRGKVTEEILGRDKVQDDKQIIIDYFSKYYYISDPSFLTTNITRNPQVVRVKKWIALFTYRTGKYIQMDIANSLGYTNHSTIVHHLSDIDFQVANYTKTKKEYLIHLDNLRKLFVTFDKIKM